MLPASSINGSPKKSSTQYRQLIEIDGEPDLLTGTLDESQAYWNSLSALPQENENTQLEIAVADSRIARLKADR